MNTLIGSNPTKSLPLGIPATLMPITIYCPPISFLENATTHQVETFTFKNNVGVDVNDLEVQFNTEMVKTKDPGILKKAITRGSKIILSKGTVPDNDGVTSTFEKEGGEFKIVVWQWTVDEAPQGATKTGRFK